MVPANWGFANVVIAVDAHAGATVKHRSRVARDPTQPNLRQVHLVHAELFEELAGLGFRLAPGDIDYVSLHGTGTPSESAKVCRSCAMSLTTACSRP